MSRVWYPGYDIRTPPHLATLPPEPNIEIVKTLLDAGADPNADDCKGDTPLHNAESSKNVVDMLLTEGANSKKKNKCGETALRC